MRLRGLSVRDFRCIEAADVEFEDGLNVLHGPNDLGKSTLVEAIRAALLLQHTSKQGSGYKPWGTDRVPRVELRLTDDDDRHWRVRKAFSTGRRGSATLEWSNDGAIWTLQDKNRGVDGKLRELLAWGVPDAGAKGGRGAPSSFLATILVGPQMQPGAVFNTSLAEDRSESGRERLGEALQALAEDPVFKEVLDRAQHLVELAFAKEGRKRTGKTSPFRPVQDRIKELTAKLRELDQQVLSSENVRDQLGTLQHTLDVAMNDAAEANAALARVETAWKASVAHAQAQERVAAAAAAVEELHAQQRSMEKLRDDQHELSLQRPAAEAALAQAEEARATAEQAVADARRKVEEIEAGGDAEGKLHKQSLQTRRLELQTQRDKVYERLTRIESTLAKQSALEELREHKARADRDLDAASKDAQAAERRRRMAEAERKALDGAIALRRLQDAEQQLAAAQAARTSAATLRAQAAELRKQADDAQAEVEGKALPSSDAVAALRTMHQALELAEARLGGGLSLSVHGSPAGGTATADDGASVPLAEGGVIEAGRRITIALADGTRLEVVGGEAEARAEAARLRDGWTTDGAPVLSRCGVDSVAALDTLRRGADETLAEAGRLRSRATSSEAQAQTHDAVAAEESTRADAVARRAEAIAGLDRTQLQHDAADADEAALLDRRNRAEAAMDEEGRTAALRAKEVAELQADVGALQRRVTEDEAELKSALAAVGGDAAAMADRVRDEHAAVEGKLEQAEEALDNVERESAGRLTKAQAEVQRVQRSLDDARDRQASASKRLDGMKTGMAAVEGQLREKEALAERTDRDAVAATLARREAELQALPPPTEPVDADAVAKVREAATDAAARVAELDKALASQRGELKQVGGNVVLQDRQETENALSAAHADENQLELDYEAYRLLVDVMRQTESAEGHHLGQALAGPVRERFARLTGGRYGALRLDSDLDAKGLEAGGGLRSIDALSAGLQEQLATLLRLAVAEQLDSALVLDDHLTQTDPSRIEWFRDALAETAGKTQVVVMTCRHTDYLEGAQHEDRSAVHAVDLTKVIRRVPSTAELPAAD